MEPRYVIVDFDIIKYALMNKARFIDVCKYMQTKIFISHHPFRVFPLSVFCR